MLIQIKKGFKINPYQFLLIEPDIIFKILERKQGSKRRKSKKINKTYYNQNKIDYLV